VTVEEEDHGKVEALDATGVNTSGAGGEVGEASVRSLLVSGAEELIENAIPVAVKFVDPADRKKDTLVS
jgi:hypothetical protein